MTQRVSQEAVEAVIHRWGGNADPVKVRADLQAALPALEADLRERLAREFLSQAEASETLHDYSVKAEDRAGQIVHGEAARCFREAAALARTLSATDAAFPPSPKEEE